MKPSIAFAVALLIPLSASADTLLLKNGNRYNGNFVSGNQQVIQFTEYNGNRQTVNMYDVQELRFGAQNASGYQGAPPPQAAGGALNAAIDRLENDLRAAVENSNLPEDQRHSVRDSRQALRHALEISQSGQEPDRPALRLAMDNIRSVMNDPSVRPEDRDRVLGDLEQTRSVFPGMNNERFGRGRNY